MRARNAVAVLCGSALILSSCSTAKPTFTQAAPAASISIVYANPPISGNPPNGTTRNKYVNLIVRHGLFNALTVRRNGSTIPLLDQTDVSKVRKYQMNDWAYYFESSRRFLPDSKEWLQSLDIYFPAHNGEVDAYELTDESISPNFKGTPQGEAKVGFNITYVESPAISYFGCPKCTIDSSGHPSVVNGQTAVIQWNVKNASKLELFDDAGVAHEVKLSGTWAVPLKGEGFKVFFLRAYNIWGDTVEYRTGVDVNDYDNMCIKDQAPYMDFCVTCSQGFSGSYKINYTSPGCSEAASKANILAPGAGCQVEVGNCPSCPITQGNCENP